MVGQPGQMRAKWPLKHSKKKKTIPSHGHAEGENYRNWSDDATTKIPVTE
jgi:hypothetical protein